MIPFVAIRLQLALSNMNKANQREEIDKKTRRSIDEKMLHLHLNRNKNNVMSNMNIYK